MNVAARLFIGMGLFGLTAGSIYYLANPQHREFAGIGLLGAFFVACLFVGVILWSASPSNRRRAAAPDTGLPGSADPVRGAADEHGHIHHLPATLAPAVFSLAGAVILGALVYRKQLSALGPFGLALGVVLFLAATVTWYRAIAVDTRARLAPHGGPEGGEHGVPVTEAVPQVPATPGPANYYEQVREALEVGDPDWAAAAYAPDAVYYEPANPPHEGREAIRAYLNDLLKGHRELEIQVRRLGADADSAIVEWTWSFRTPDNRRVTGQAGASVIQVGPGGIVYHRDYL